MTPMTPKQAVRTLAAAHQQDIAIYNALLSLELFVDQHAQPEPTDGPETPTAAPEKPSPEPSPAPANETTTRGKAPPKPARKRP